MEFTNQFLVPATLAFVSVFVLVTVVCLIVYAIPDKQTTKQTISYKDIAENGKTFDLLGVAYKSLSCAFVKMFTNSKWSHIAMLYRDKKNQNQNTDLYVIEMIRCRSCKYDVQVHPFSVWYAKASRYSILYLPRTQDDSAFSSAYDKIIKLTTYHHANNTRVNMNLFDWIKTLQKHPYVTGTGTGTDYEIQREYFCSEFIVMLLQQAGIFKKLAEPSNFTPVELLFPQKNKTHFGHFGHFGVQNSVSDHWSSPNLYSLVPFLVVP